MKFIRKNGRVIPIYDDHDIAAAKQNAKRSVNAAIAHGTNEGAKALNDAYNANLSQGQKDQVKKGFGLFEKLVATGATLASGKAILDAAHEGAQDYNKKANSEFKKYGSIAAGGTIAATGGAMSAFLHGGVEHAAMKQFKIGGLSNYKKGHSLLSIAKKMKIGGRIGVGAGLVAAGVGFYGREKALKHVNRSDNLLRVTSFLKKHTGG
jgi:hypothetical protein